MRANGSAGRRDDSVPVDWFLQVLLSGDIEQVDPRLDTAYHHHSGVDIAGVQLLWDCHSVFLWHLPVENHHIYGLINLVDCSAPSDAVRTSYRSASQSWYSVRRSRSSSTTNSVPAVCVIALHRPQKTYISDTVSTVQAAEKRSFRCYRRECLSAAATVFVTPVHTTDMPDIVVRRHSVHGMPADQYAETLRERLPDHDIALAETPATERALVTDATVITGSAISSELLERADSLRCFASTYAGYEHLPLEMLAAEGVALTTASGVHGPNIAEYVIGAWLSFARGFLTARRQQDNNAWQAFQAADFAGNRVCVVGMGAIGSAIIDRLDGFGVETVGVRHTPEKGGPVEAVYGYDEIHEAVAGARYVALACPLTEETRELIDKSVLETMHPESVLVNIARGPVVDTDALVDSLQRNEIAGATLDVTDPEPLPGDHPLWEFENVLITPHNAGHTPSYYERLADIVTENVRQAEETGEWRGLQNQVEL